MYMIDGIGTSKNVHYKLLTAKVFPLRSFLSWSNYYDGAKISVRFKYKTSKVFTIQL